MIISPDFPDHWKTRMLVDLLNDESAPLYLIRIWGHCQNRKTSVFTNLPPAGLKALCRYAGDAEKLESAFIAAGFIRRDGGNVEVHQWDEYNSSLIANWENGKKGGRKPKANPTETHRLPIANPIETHSEPVGSPTLTDREDKIREEKIEKIEKKTESVIQPFEVPDQVWNDFLKLRKAKKAPLTQTALDAIEREVKISGWTLEDALTECVSRGWQGFKASWVANQSNQQDEYPQRAC